MESIHALLTELEEDRETLARALHARARQAAQLEAANADLTRQLTAQTQRLELLYKGAEAAPAAALAAPKPAPPAAAFIDEEPGAEEDVEELVDGMLSWLLSFVGRGGRPRGRGAAAKPASSS